MIAPLFCRATYVREIPTADCSALGGWSRLDRIFNGKLEQAVGDINKSIWQKAEK